MTGGTEIAGGTVKEGGIDDTGGTWTADVGTVMAGTVTFTGMVSCPGVLVCCDHLAAAWAFLASCKACCCCNPSSFFFFFSCFFFFAWLSESFSCSLFFLLLCFVCSAVFFSLVPFSFHW